MYKKIFTLFLFYFIISCSLNNEKNIRNENNENNLGNTDFNEEPNFDKSNFIINTNLGEK